MKKSASAKFFERDDRARQVQTTKERHGSDFYRKLGAKSATFKDVKLAKLAALKRWHPDWFDEEGNLKEEYDVSNS